jgi:hypothetical protein
MQRSLWILKSQGLRVTRLHEFVEANLRRFNREWKA